MLSDLINASSWSHEQWLIVSILVFIVLAVLVMLHRMVKIFRMSQRQRYTPNLRPLRRRRIRRTHVDNDADKED